MNSLDMTVRETGSMFTVDARALYEWLGVRKTFTQWFAYQLDRVKMVEGVHYERIFTNIGKNSRGRPAQGYMVTLSAAKHIGMMSNTDRGDQVRQYFEACESKLKEVSKPKEIQQAMSPLEMMRAQYEMFGLMLQNQIDLQNQTQRNTEQYAIADSRISAIEHRMKVEEEFVTIVGFLSINGIKNKTQEEIKILGMRVSKYCKENGIKIAHVPSVRHGKVNAYPRDVLDTLMGGLL